MKSRGRRPINPPQMPKASSAARPPIAPMAGEQLIGAPQVAALLGISIRQVYRLRSLGKIDPVHLLGSVRFRRSQVHALMQSGAERAGDAS